MSLCCYVTGHGYGHAIRTAQVLKALPADLPLTIKTTVPQQLFAEELGSRPFEYIRAEYDCGCVQPDSVTILKRESLDRYAAIAARNREQLDAEAQFLADRRFGAIACDAPSFPLAAAKQAGVPGVFTSNFTWCDIYRNYVETLEDCRLVDHMAREYADASLALISELETPTAAATFPNVERVPLTARIGKRRRDELAAAVKTDCNLGLLYLGTWGLDIDWKRIESIRSWHFVTFDPVPGELANVTLLSRDNWIYADAAASVDAMICKVGYGAVTDCIGNSTPMVHLPRRDFAEYDALVAGMDRWGGRCEASEEDFIAGRWEKALEKALTARIRPDEFRTDGAAVIASRLMQLASAA